TYGQQDQNMRTLPSEEPSNIHCWAARAFLEMEGAGVLPTPHNFDLWFTHVSGADPGLSRQIAAILNVQSVMTPEALEGLHASFPSPKVDIDEVVDRAEAMELAAQAMVDEIASNEDQLRLYGNTLSHWTTQLTQRQTSDNLLQAVTALSTETGRAAERNRVLEQRLSAASVRITRLKDGMAVLKHTATTDTLTGLFDRKAFNAKLHRALAEAKTDGTSVSLLMIDMDHFKQINDKFGHHTGDLVLRLIGRLLIDSVKGRDRPARYGGEEFVVLLVGADLE